MTPEMWITLAILVAAIVLFITELIRIDIVALGVVIALMLTNILTPGQALAGFSSTSVLTIAALFIVGGAVFQTGLASSIAKRLLAISGTNYSRLLVLVMLSAAVISGVLSDTGVVAVMLPAIVSLAIATKTSPSRLLIPLAYGSLLGGKLTLIGTPPNIIVSDLLRENGYEAFDFFSFMPLGIILVIVGVIFMLTIGKRLLPDHKPKQVVQQFETPKELFELYKLPDNLFRMRVRSKSPLIGMRLADANFSHDFGVNVLEIVRSAQPRQVAAFGGARLTLETAAEGIIHPTADTVLQDNDVLITQGEGNDVGRAAGSWNLGIQPADAKDADALLTSEVGIAEILLRPRSGLLGRTIREMSFGSTHKLTVLDIRRPDMDGKIDIKETPLRMGDTLLVQGRWKDIFALKDMRHDFIVMGEPEAKEAGAGLRQNKMPHALLIMVLMILALVVTGLPLVMIAMIAGLGVVLLGCLTMDEAYEAIDWKSLVLIAGMLPMATALEQVGLVDMAANGFTSTLGDYGPHAVLAGLFILTAVFTQVLSNTATAVLVAPIGFAIATSMGINPRTLLMGIAFAASAAFASPVASPVNTLVMGAGRYKFRDFVKVGVPMMGVAFAVTIIFLPILFPF